MDESTSSTRDLDTLDESDEQLDQFELGYPDEPGQGQRPQFSPVAQPGMNDNIHWGTVRTGPGPGQLDGGQPAEPAAEPGMFRRLHEELITRRGGGGGKHKRRQRQQRQ